MKLTENKIALILFSILLLAICTYRLATLDHHSLWLDELGSFYLSGLSLGELLSSEFEKVHPPFFYLVLKVYIFTTGAISEFALRLPNYLYNVIGAGFISLILVKEHSENRLLTAVMGATIFLSFIAVFRYSAELRPYSLGSALLLGFLYFYFHKRNTIAAFAFFGLALQTHYLLYPYLFSIMALDVFYKKRMTNFHWSTLICAVIFFLIFLSRTSLSDIPYWDLENSGNQVKGLLKLYFKTFYYHFEFDKNPIYFILNTFYSICLLLAILFTFKKMLTKKLGLESIYVLGAVLPLIIYSLAPFNRFTYKFAYFSYPFFSILMAKLPFVLKTRFQAKVRLVLFVLLLGLSTYTLSGNYFSENKMPDWRSAIQSLNSKKGDRIRDVFVVPVHPGYYIDKIDPAFNVNLITVQALKEIIVKRDKPFYLLFRVFKGKSLEDLISDVEHEYNFIEVESFESIILILGTKNNEKPQ